MRVIKTTYRMYAYSVITDGSAIASKQELIYRYTLKQCRDFLSSTDKKVTEIRKIQFGIHKFNGRKIQCFSLSRVYHATNGTWPKFRNVKVKQFPDRVLDMSLVKKVEE